MESQRQLLSAVGHDLRTPITAMRISLEFVEDNELRERLQHSLDELQELTEAVLSAARGTGGEVKRNVDLAALIDSLCADLDDLGEPVKWKAHTSAPLSCRPNEIRRAVRNLVENALRYGSGRVVVEVMTPCTLSVRNGGPGVSPEQLRTLQQRHVRHGPDRAGYGLGLSIVGTIVEKLGARLDLTSPPQGATSGFEARIVLRSA